MYKSFASITLPITEDEYRNDGNLHYSMLATYDREGFNAIAKLDEKKESPSLLFGSLVDIMLTGSQEEFEKQYFVADFPELKPMHLKFANELFKRFHEKYATTTKIPESDIINTALEIEFYPTWRPDSYVKAARNDCEEYYRLMVAAEGKTVVSQKTYSEAVAAATVLRESPATAPYFADNDPFGDIERVYQAKFKSTFGGITYSAMADIIVIDHKNKKIYPCDLKTSSHKEHEFFYSFLEWRYYIQANQYAAIIQDNIQRDEYFKDFTIEPYRFIVVNKDSLTPLLWVWKYTFSHVTVEIEDAHGKKHIIRPFHQIGKEVHHYLKTGQKLPEGITATGLNSLDTWIRKM